MSLITQMQRIGLWGSFTRHVVNLEPILQAMSDRGVPVDATRWESLERLLTRDMKAALDEMQTLVPDALLKVKAYKRPPKKVTEAHYAVDATCGMCINGGVEECKACKGERVVRTWFRREVWKPSTKNLIAYMKHRGHPVPKDFSGEKDTTGQVQLARLFRSTHDRMYEKVLHYRKAQTVKTNHLKNWKPQPDGRVHPTFYFDPATGQLSSRRPNTQNAPHHDDPEFGGYAKPFREMIAAPPGHSIVEFDMKSAHVQTLAFEAEDATLLRIAKLDVHSFVTAHFLHLGEADKLLTMPDDELADRLKWIKRNYKHDRDAKVKHAFLGYDNGLGYRKLYQQYKEYFENEGEAKRVMQLFDSLFPITKRYREEICRKAHEQGYLMSRHGHIRYFYEVFRVKWERRNGQWQEVWSHGDDHEAALSYFTQNDAHCELRDRMLWLEEVGIPTRFNMINTIHDSLKFVWPNTQLDRINECKSIMERNSKVLVNSICPNGLSIEIEHKVGPDWANAK